MTSRYFNLVTFPKHRTPLKHHLFLKHQQILSNYAAYSYQLYQMSEEDHSVPKAEEIEVRVHEESDANPEDAEAVSRSRIQGEQSESV